jgi:hypothetical protein
LKERKKEGKKMFDANSDTDKKFSQFPAQPTIQRSVSAPAIAEHVRIIFLDNGLSFF